MSMNMSLFDHEDKTSMENDFLITSGAWDIRRRKAENDTTFGGVTVTSTAIETRQLDLQNLRAEEVVALGGLRIEAQYRGYIHKIADIREGDILTPDSGTTRYEITGIEGLWDEHLQFFAKKVV